MENPKSRAISDTVLEAQTYSVLNDVPQAWIVDYAPARDRAIRWLGERYLLARAINQPAVKAFHQPPRLN